MDRKAEGVHATSADFLRYDQVDKKQRYHLAESAEDAFDDSYEIKTCDLGRWLQGGPARPGALARARAAFDDSYEIKTCDRGRWLQGGPDDQRAFARELGDALEGIGFAILEGH